MINRKCDGGNDYSALVYTAWSRLMVGQARGERSARVEGAAGVFAKVESAKGECVGFESATGESVVLRVPRVSVLG